MTYDQLQMDFNKGYAYDSSLPAYHSNPKGKQAWATYIYSLVIQLKETNLKQLEEMTGLPQSSVAGRINNLRESGKVKYACDSDGKLLHTFYNGRLRKKIVLV